MGEHDECLREIDILLQDIDDRCKVEKEEEDAEMLMVEEKHANRTKALQVKEGEHQAKAKKCLEQLIKTEKDRAARVYEFVVKANKAQLAAQKHIEDWTLSEKRRAARAQHISKRIQERHEELVRKRSANYLERKANLEVLKERAQQLKEKAEEIARTCLAVERQEE